MDQRLIFFSIAIIVIFSMAYLTAMIYTKTMNISHPVRRATVLGSLLVPLFFLASIITSRSVSWGIGSTLYTAINTIAGICLYLFMGAVMLAAMFLVAILLKTILPTYLPHIIFGSALLLGIGGVVQSRFIKVTHYDVIIQNLPAEMLGKKAVLVSDTHFGLINHIKFSDRVVNIILKINPDFVLHAGDFYDGPKIETASITKSWNKLASKIPVFYAPGNHEMYGDYLSFVESIRASGVNVLDNKKMMYRGIEIGGITYAGGKDSVEATSNIENIKFDKNAINILINHPPTSLDAAEKNGVDLVVSGHTHNGQFWPNNYIIRSIYDKFAYGLNRHLKMQVLTTSGVGTFGPPNRLFNTPEIVVINFK